MNKTCVIIAGPTASGKTNVAIELAKQFNTEIISADSRQCYKELNIGVAKPTDEQLQAVLHHFINSHSITENLSAADFEKYALGNVNKIFKKNDVAIMAGGTGLYIKAFCEGMDEIPGIEPDIRNAIVTDYNNNGIQWLQQQVKSEDADYFIKGEMQNPQRMIRALEVKRSTGMSIISFQNKNKKIRNFNILKIGLELPREVLYERINIRVDEMMQMGLAEEAKGMEPYKHLNALNTVGYKELFDFFDLHFTQQEARETGLKKTIDNIKQNTRHYAKRQMTWFKKDKEIIWCEASHNPSDVSGKIIELINKL